MRLPCVNPPRPTHSSRLRLLLTTPHSARSRSQICALSHVRLPHDHYVESLLRNFDMQSSYSLRSKRYAIAHTPGVTCECVHLSLHGCHELLKSSPVTVSNDKTNLWSDPCHSFALLARICPATSYVICTTPTVSSPTIVMHHAHNIFATGSTCMVAQSLLRTLLEDINTVYSMTSGSLTYLHILTKSDSMLLQC